MKALKTQTVPLTKRFLERSASKAGRKAAQSAMETAGFVIKVEDGWLVREDFTGNVSRIRPIEVDNGGLRLD
jgi:hypothetical protein